jgi:hypothetical protein
MITLFIYQYIIECCCLLLYVSFIFDISMMKKSRKIKRNKKINENYINKNM